MKEEEEIYMWLFSDYEYFDGKIDIHFVLNNKTGQINKIIQRRTVSEETSEGKYKEILYEEKK